MLSYEVKAVYSIYLLMLYLYIFSHSHNVHCVTKSISHMETKFRNKVISLIKENFSPFEFAAVFNLDNGNACAYLRGSKKIPLSLCFSVLEYLGAKLAIFRS